MRSRILATNQELDEFGGRFAERGNPVSLSYLRRAQVRAFYDRKGQMFAGYAMNRSEPLRYWEWVPEAARAGSTFAVKRPDCCELTCIWISGGSTTLTTGRIYAWAMLDALRSGAGYVVGGTLNPIVFGIQSQVLSQNLYQGPTEYFGHSRACFIYGATRLQLARWLVFSLPRVMLESLFGRPSYLSRARGRARKVAPGVQGPGHQLSPTGFAGLGTDQQ